MLSWNENSVCFYNLVVSLATRHSMVIGTATVIQWSLACGVIQWSLALRASFNGHWHCVRHSVVIGLRRHSIVIG
jgi:hypothetical protein